MSRNEKTALVVVLLSVGAVLLSVMAGLGYYGFKRYMERTKEARRDLERRLTSDSTTDATADIVDDDYRFKLAYPGAGFKLMSEEHASRIQQDALAGAMGHRCWFTVTAEHLPGGDIDDVTTAYIDAMRAAEKKQISREETTLGGKRGRTVVIDATVQGMPLRYRHLVIDNDGWFIRAMAWSQIDSFADCSTTLDRSFSITPGAVKGRTHAIRQVDRARAAYRLRGSTFESPAYRMRVQIPEGFRIEVAPEALAYDPHAAVALTKGTIVVAIGTERAPEGSLAGALEAYTREHTTQVGALLPRRWSKRVAGSDIELRTFDGIKPFQTAWGLAHVDGLRIHVRMLYPAPLAQNADAALDAALASIQILPQAEANAIAADLPKVDSGVASSPTESLRNGVYTDYQHRFRLQLPEEQIIPALEPELVGVTASSVLLIRPASGVTTAVLPDTDKLQGSTAGAMVNAAMALSGLSEGAARPKLVSSTISGVTRGHVGFLFPSGERARYDMHEVVGKNLVFVTFGLEPNVVAAEQATDALVRGFTHDPSIIEHDLSSSRLRNNRVGFQLDLPGSGFTSQIVDMGAMGSLLNYYKAENDSVEIGVFSLSAELQDEDFIVPVFEQTMAERMPGKRVPTRKRTRLGKLDARHLVWDNGFEMAIAGEESRFFAVFIGPKKPGAVDAETVFKGFRVD